MTKQRKDHLVQLAREYKLEHKGYSTYYLDLEYYFEMVRDYFPLEERRFLAKQLGYDGSVQ